MFEEKFRMNFRLLFQCEINIIIFFNPQYKSSHLINGAICQNY